MKPSISFPGAPMALASAALFGTSTPLAKLLLGGGVDPWLLAGLLYLGSGLGACPRNGRREADGLIQAVHEQDLLRIPFQPAAPGGVKSESVSMISDRAQRRRRQGRQASTTPVGSPK